MKTEFRAAVTQLSAERHLPREVVLSALESALISAFKKEAFSPEQSISVKIDPEGRAKVYLQKVVAEEIADPHTEISITEAHKFRSSAQIGDIVEIESTPKNAGRIAAQIARQVILQRLREAESHAIYEEFAGREGDVVTGIIQFIEPKQIYVGVGRTEAILPPDEQVTNERYYKGQRLKFYLLELTRGTKGPQIIVSRSHPNLIRRLFELEIPEITNGTVEIRTVAREAGYRSKIAVSSNLENIEPVGCCLGPRGIRIQSILAEISGEKIDVVQWHANPETFISNALSPAQVISIEIESEQKVANVIVSDRQLSLAIGKEGQNARLAAKLTGWRINIKSASTIEAERALERKTIAAEAIPEEITPEEPIPVEPVRPEPVVREIEEEEELEFVIADETPSEKVEEPPQIRFAEDIMPSRSKAEIPGKEKETGKSKAKKGKKRPSYVKDDEYEEST